MSSLLEIHNRLNQQNLILDCVNANIFICSLKHEVIYCNEAQLKALNLPKNKVISKNLTDLLSPNDSPTIIANNNQVIYSQRNMTFTENITYRQRNYTYVTNKSPYYLDGQLIGVLGVSITPSDSHFTNHEHNNLDSLDIIQKISSLTPNTYEYQEAINRHPNLLMSYIETILDIMPGSFFCIDKSQRLIACNNHQAKIFGFEHRNDLINYTIDNIPGLCQHTIKQVKENNKLVLSSDKTETLTETGLGRTFLSYKKRITDSANNPIGVVGISLDMTELTTAQQQLREERDNLHSISQAKTRFIMNISHDLRTPCAGILSLTQLLIDKNTKPEQLEYLQDIKNSIKQLTKILNQSIDYVRHENGVIPIDFTRFNIHQLIDNIITLYTPETKHKGIKLEHIPQQPATTFCSDAQRIQQILINLIGNAVKFTNKGSIKITSKITPADQLEICIIDTGCGIEAAYHNKIFDAFTRIQDSYADNQRGSGLGLSLVKRLLKEIDGSIHVDSSLNQGSKFSIFIQQQQPKKFKMKRPPNSQTTTTILDQPLCLTENGKYYKVLIIEDEPIARKVSHALLLKYGCIIDVAANGQTALNKPLEIYDLIISDIGLPDIDGFELGKKIRAYLKNFTRQSTPIIGVTAHLHPEFEFNKRKQKNPFDFIITKPLTCEFLEKL